MTSDTGYNGYRNRATWNLVLWLMNDEGIYSRMMSRLVPKVSEADLTDRERASKCRHYCEREFGDRTPDGDSLRSVYWPQVAEAVMECA